MDIRFQNDCSNLYYSSLLFCISSSFCNCFSSSNSLSSSSLRRVLLTSSCLLNSLSCCWFCYSFNKCKTVSKSTLFDDAVAQVNYLPSLDISSLDGFMGTAIPSFKDLNCCTTATRCEELQWLPGYCFL